ncbi:MAG TPA: hypothetical protein VMM76_18085 [Pirellulaceae bacterium]|nr:hypothetical protein [Pirellulaceae bacterium]
MSGDSAKAVDNPAHDTHDPASEQRLFTQIAVRFEPRHEDAAPDASLS